MNLFGKNRGLNLRMKFILPISAMLIFSMLVIGGYLVGRQSDSYLRELRSTGETMLQMVAINAESGVLFESKYQLDDELSALTRIEHTEYAVIYTIDGEAIASIGQREGNGGQLSADSLITLLAHNDHIHYECRNFGSEVLVLAMPVVTEKKILHREHLGITGGMDEAARGTFVSEPIGCVELALSLDKVKESIMEATTATVLLTVLVVISAIIILTLIINAVTNPITEMVSVTGRVGLGDLSQRVEIDRRDEIGQLASTFNGMIDSLRQSRDEIEEYNRNLEEKIIERTAQLEEAQAQLVQSEKLSAIGQLAAGVAHELNNPLGGILGYAQFTLEKLRKNTPDATTPKEIEGYVRYVSDIEVQARRCKMIVQNLLRFSRSSQSVDFEPVDINQAIEETISFVGHQLRLRQIELELELDRDLPKIQGNVGQLQQVFTNLIINGMHASKAGSVFKIVSRYSPALGEFGGAVELLFVDEGCGIKEENLKKIFEPFFTTKEVGQGTGLGLSVSYGIVRAHQGEITVRSEIGKGTTFTIILPVQNPAPTSDNTGDKLSSGKPS
jgi:signal transduction histidine kinase